MTDEQDSEQPDDLAYEAWAVIANAPGCWDEDTEWRRAAIRWRDRWHAMLPVVAST